MPDIPSNDPQLREDRGPSAIGGLLKVLAFTGIALAAYKGSGIILKHLPEARVAKLRDAMSVKVLKLIERVEKHPSYRSLSRRLLDTPGNTNDLVLSRVLREVSSGEIGLLNDLEMLTRVSGEGSEQIYKAARERLIANYERGIKPLSDGAHRRMTLKDLIRSTQDGFVELPNAEVIKKLDMGMLSRKLGMNRADLEATQLDPYLFIHKSGRVKNLNRINLPARALDALEDVKFMGIPFFKVSTLNKAGKFGVGVFGRLTEDDDTLPNPLLRMLVGKDKGQLAVVGNRAWFRNSTGDGFKPVKLMHEIAMTSDSKMGEMFVRSGFGAKEFDDLMYPGTGVGKVNAIRKFIGVGREYLPKTFRGVLEDVARIDKAEAARQGGFRGLFKRTLLNLDPTGLAGSLGPADLPGRGFGTPSVAMGRGQHVYLQRKGFGGFSDWLNVHATRPYYLLNKAGVGLRPGRNALSSLGKMSILAMGAYGAKEALSYADWLTFGVGSSAVKTIAGGVTAARQGLLDITGARSGIEGMERETPGIFNSPLAQALRLGAMAYLGARIGKRAGFEKLGGKFIDKIPGLAKLLAPESIRDDLVAGATAKMGSLSKFKGAVLGGIFGAALGAATMGNLTETPKQTLERIRGDRLEPYRASSGWMLGRDPFAGGRVRFHKPSFLHSFGTDYQSIGVYGSEGNKWRYGSWLPTPSNWFGLRRLLNPYYAEERNAATRPYPVTSGEFGEVPIFGPALQSTIGSIIKPERYRDLAAMNDAIHAVGGGGSVGAMTAYGQFAGSGRGYRGVGPVTASGLGLQPGMPGLRGYSDPNSLLSGAFGTVRAFEEYSGLRGFQVQFLREKLGMQPAATPRLAQSGTMSSAVRGYYDAEPGGLLGGTELLRRFLLRPDRNAEFNPIPNSLPRWLPGSQSIFEQDRSFYTDLSVGDPYTKVPLGEARLPGPGRDALYKKHGGSAYDVVDAFLITADVAPFTQAYRTLKAEVERLIRKGQLDREWVTKYSIAVEQAEQRSSFRVFHSDRMRQHQQFTIEQVLGPTQFTVKERPGQVFRLGGTQLDYAEPMGLIASRMSSGMDIEQAKKSVQDDKNRLKRMLQDRVGRSISVDITGQSGGKYITRIPELEGQISNMGITQEDRLYDQGMFGKAYTATGKLVGEGGFLTGLVLGLAPDMLRIGQFGNKVMQKGSIAAKGLQAFGMAAIGGIVGGWFENKFTGDFSAVEHYERFQKYGSSYANWMTPYSSFIRPWINTGLSTFGDYTPIHKQKQYAMEEYFDNLKYAKYAALEQQANQSGDSNAAFAFSKMKMGTRTALDYTSLTANTPGLIDAIPENERQYFKQFSAEQDSEERLHILEAVPDYMKSVYLAIWNNNMVDGEQFELEELQQQYARYVTPLTKSNPEDRVTNYFSSHYLPPPNWAGWHPNVSLSDVKYKTVEFSGGSPHDHGLFAGQGAKIDAYSPDVIPAAEDLANRVPSVISPIDLDRAKKMIGSLASNMDLRMVPGLGETKIDIYNDDSSRYDAYYQVKANRNVGIY